MRHVLSLISYVRAFVMSIVLPVSSSLFDFASQAIMLKTVPSFGKSSIPSFTGPQNTLLLLWLKLLIYQFLLLSEFLIPFTSLNLKNSLMYSLSMNSRVTPETKNIRPSLPTLLLTEFLIFSLTEAKFSY